MFRNPFKIGCILFLLVFFCSPPSIDDENQISNITKENDNSFIYNDSNKTIWSMYQYDLQNTGRNPNALNDNPGKLRWRFYLDDEPTESCIIDGTGIIYIAESWGTDFYALYSNNGSIKWKNQLDYHVSSSPAISNDSVYIVTRLGTLYSFHRNGSLQWKTDEIGQLTASSPVIDNEGNIIFGSWDRFIYCYYPNGSLNWKYKLDWRTISTAAIDNEGNIYITAYNETGPPYTPGIIYSLYPNGTLRWKCVTNYIQYNSISISKDGILYVVTKQYDNNHIFAIYSLNGTIKWKIPSGWPVWGGVAPSIGHDGTIYIATNDGRIRAYHPNGTNIWMYSTGGEIQGSSIAIDGNGMLYFGARNSNIYCLFPNGNLKWKYKTGGFITHKSILDDNTNVYIGSSDGYLYSIGLSMPDQPSNVQRRSGFQFINISWEDPENFDESEVMGYRVYRYNSDGLMNMIADLGKDTHFFNDTSLINGNNYSHSLVAYNRDGDGKDFFLPPIAPLSRSLEPRNLTIYPGPNLINLTWDPPIDSGGYSILYYNIYRATGSVFTLVEKSNETFYSDTSLNVNIKYHYKVSAVTEYGEGKMSDIVSGISFVVPSTPRNFSLSTDNGYVDITWDAPAYDGGKPIVHYQLYRNGSEYRKLDPDTISYRDEYVVTGIKYSYQLSAFNIVGEGWKTENVTIFPLGIPGAPIGLTAELLPDGVRLTWYPPLMDGGTTVNNYSIYRSAGDSFKLIDISEYLQYIDNQIDRGQSYFYYVTSTNAIGEGPGSDEVEIIIPQIDLPGTPLNVHLELKGNGVEISWDRPENYMESNMEGYHVYRRIEEYYEVERISTLGETSYTDGVVQANYTYHYSISAYNQYGESNPSDPVSIQIPSGTIIESDGDNGDDGISTILILIIIVIIVVILLSLIGILVFFLLKPARKKEDVILNEEDKEKQPSYSDTLESLFQDQKENLSKNEGISNDLIPGENEMI